MEKGPNGRNSRDIRICEYRQLTHLLTFTNILCFRVRKKVKRKASESLLFGSLRHWWRTYVPFAQWSPEALGAGFILPFALTNSSRFLLRRTAHRADASLVCPPRSWGHRTEPYSISPSKKDHSFRKALLLGGISRTRTYVPFAQWSPEALGAGFILPFALTNSSRFLLRRTAHRADASLVCPHDRGVTGPNLTVFHQAKRTIPFGRPFCLVGLVGLEPMTPTMSTWCSNQLSYNPMRCRTGWIIAYCRTVCKCIFEFVSGPV